MSAANGHGSCNAGPAANGPGGPYEMTIAGLPLNWPVPPVWNGMVATGGCGT